MKARRLCLVPHFVMNIVVRQAMCQNRGAVQVLSVILLTGTTSLLFRIVILVSVTLLTALPAHAKRLSSPTNLQQLDDFGIISVGELVDNGTLVFRFLVVGETSQVLVPQVEVRPVSEPFVEANLIGDPLIASGGPQWVSIQNHDPFTTAGYHWRARVVVGQEPSPWIAFGDTEDHVDPPHLFADADFYSVYEPLAVNAKPLVGFDSLVHISHLPLIISGATTHQVSSFDRTEGNADGGSAIPGLESYFYREGTAEVVLEADGPGQITRIWFAESNDPAFPNTRLQFFFDGSQVVDYEISVADLVSGQRPPFVSPFVLNADRSSGGLISYVPIPFREGIKVRFAGPHAHYQISYQLFNQDVDVTTFTGNEDYTLAQHLWHHLGEDPKPTRGNQTWSYEGGLAPGSTLILPDLQGCGVLQSLEVRLPPLLPSIVGTPPLDDHIRAHLQGESQFMVTPLESQKPTRLRIRRGCQYTPQTARVYLEGQSLGTWMRGEGNDRYRWCEDTFDLPTSQVHSDVPLNLRITSIHPDNAWEEAHYWLEQRIGTTWIVADEVDIGDGASELAHAYEIVGQTAEGWRTYTYPPVLSSQPDSIALLAGLRLQITADQYDVPQVDVPFGAFFGSAVGVTNMASLLTGIDPATQSFYSFWPMPYGTRLQIKLVNNSPFAVEQVSVGWTSANRCYPLLGQRTGYFNVIESLSRPTTLDVDHSLVEAHGAGRVVGLHLLVHSGDEGLIEGDERWHLDGSLAPQVRGTGTEDIFNGGWYYNRGRVIAPLHGANSTRLEGWIDQYRWYIADAITFSDHVRGGIEHGGVNELNADYSSWTYLYLAPDTGMLLYDGVDFADDLSMMDHDVTITGSFEEFTLTSQFEGDDDTNISGGGLRLGEGSVLTATLTVDPSATHVILRRRYDQGVDKERIRVWVDGQLAGDWLDGGRNVARRWRESTFLLSADLTKDQETLTLRFEPVDWSGSRNISLSQLTALSLHSRSISYWLPIVLHN